MITVSRMRAARASLARRTGIDGNPLRRATDRAEAWIRILLVTVFLVAAPLLTIGTGRWAATTTQASARAHAAAVQPVSATVKRAAPANASDPARSALAWVPAQWHAPDGSARSGQIQAPLGTRAGSTIKIWVDNSGKVSEPPLTHAQVLSRVITVIALTPVGLALALALLLGVVTRLLQRRRLLAWEAAWAAVEPHWTRRNHQ